MVSFKKFSSAPAAPPLPKFALGNEVISTPPPDLKPTPFFSAIPIVGFDACSDRYEPNCNASVISLIMSSSKPADL